MVFQNHDFRPVAGADSLQGPLGASASVVDPDHLIDVGRQLRGLSA
jgi:hypothetical protein